jgi:hypothetical protein
MGEISLTDSGNDENFLNTFNPVRDFGLRLLFISLKVLFVARSVAMVVVVQDRHVKLSGVLKLGTDEAEVVCEVAEGGGGSALIDNATLGHEEKSVEKRIDFVVGLVNGEENGLSRTGQSLQLVHDDEGGERVQS